MAGQEKHLDRRFRTAMTCDRGKSIAMGIMVLNSR